MGEVSVFMLKILHLADIHLDSPFKNTPYSDAVRLREETRAVFGKALDYARKQEVSAVLICGDLFDSEFYTENTVSFLAEKFASMPTCRFIISPGNHDPYKFGSPYTENVFPSNVYVFNSERLQEIDFDDIGLKVYGYAFTSASHVSRPLDGFTASGDGFNVLCAHTDTESPLSSYAPISEAELASSGLDYAALGHIHTKRDIRTVGRTRYAYSGCLTGRDFSEDGECGGVLVTLDRKDGKKTVNAERVTLCPWIYETVTVNLSGALKENLKSLLTQRLSEGEGVLDRMIRLTLTGSTDYAVDKKAILSELRDFHIKEIEVKTASALNLTELINDYSLSGEFYRTLLPMLSSEDAEERRIAAEALRLGLDALARRELE